MTVTYKLTLEEYNKKVQAQNNVCEICQQEQFKYTGRKRAYLVVDHCHTTGKIRGLLCHKCNLTIGNARENIQILENCIQYIKKYSGGLCQ